MNTPPYTPTPQASTQRQDDTSLNYSFITIHLTDAIILRSWAQDDDLAHDLEMILTAVTSDGQKTQDRFDAAIVELKDSREEDYRWVSLMKLGEALGLVPFVPEFAMHQAKLRELWKQMYGRDLELALRTGVVDMARIALGELYEEC